MKRVKILIRSEELKESGESGDKIVEERLADTLEMSDINLFKALNN